MRPTLMRRLLVRTDTQIMPERRASAVRRFGRPPQVQGGQSDQCGGCGAGDAAPAVLPRQGEAETQCDQPGHAPPAGGTDDDEAGGGGQAPATGPGPGDRAHHDQGDPPHDVEEIGAGRRRVRRQRGEGPCDDADGGDAMIWVRVADGACAGSSAGAVPGGTIVTAPVCPSRPELPLGIPL